MAGSRQADQARGPCSGIRIVDLTSIVSGPLGSQPLADLGAEVIRVEAKGSDPLRMTGPLHEDIGAYFEQINRGKKSVVVDLKSDEGRKAVRRLAMSADVFMQNSRPGVMERLGLGYEDLRRENPGLIYLSINGFGESGPFANRPAYDTVIQGLVGFMPIQAGGGGSGAFRSPIADKITGMWAANALLAALLDRERHDRRGQKVVLDMASAYASFILVDQLLEETFLSVQLPKPRRAFSPYNTLDTVDGQVIGLVLQPAQFARLATALGLPELVGDERFATPMGLMENGEAFYEAFAPVVRGMTTQEFTDLMDRLEVPFGRVNTVSQFVDSPEAEAAGVFSEISDPDYGCIRHVNYPAKFERSVVGPRGRSPRLGEHTGELLGQDESQD